jgi:hypothetical protein
MNDSGNGKNLSIMTEDEFVSAPPETAQRWIYRILCSICREQKETKKEIQEIKARKNLVQKSLTLAGGFIGGAAAAIGWKIGGFGQ